jgi:hypothetical protein
MSETEYSEYEKQLNAYRNSSVKLEEEKRDLLEELKLQKELNNHTNAVLLRTLRAAGVVNYDTRPTVAEIEMAAQEYCESKE